ncbi:MAG TPA: alpha/beta fold hydrolase [Candidatus Binatia bacterium]|nr:alpha/beta fold hydrolase [Candidatus Binatia bacterium]
MTAILSHPTALKLVNAHVTLVSSVRRRPESRFTGIRILPHIDNPFFYVVILSLIIASSCATVATSPISAGRTSTIELTSCKFPKLKEPARCGKLPVYENRAAQSGRMIALNIVVLPAQSSELKSDPVFYLAGGPGQAAAGIASAGEDPIMRELRRDRDLVFVDMRGTGESNGLQCDVGIHRAKVQGFFTEVFDPLLIHACRDKLEPIADLKFYNTQLGIEDVDDVRAALGYDRINLYGISHGSQAALEYLRRYPNHARTATLAGVVTAATKIPLQFARGAEHAMSKIFHDCAVDEACNARFPNLEAKFDQLLRSFDGGPVTFQMLHPTSKDMQSVTLSRGVFADRLLSMLYSHRTASLLPLAIDSAAQGNWSPLVLIRSRPSAPSEFRVYFGAYLSAICSESLPFIDETDLWRATAATFMVDYLTHRHSQTCANWPRGATEPDYFQPVRAATPVLMLSGDIDPATPAEFGAQALKSLPNGRQVIFRNTPHSYASPCARSLIVEFIARGSAKELDASCAKRLRRPPFATELPARYKH